MEIEYGKEAMHITFTAFIHKKAQRGECVCVEKNKGEERCFRCTNKTL